MNYSYLNVFFFLSVFTLSISFSSLVIATPSFIPGESESASPEASTHIISIKKEKEEDDESNEILPKNKRHQK